MALAEKLARRSVCLFAWCLLLCCRTLHRLFPQSAVERAYRRMEKVVITYGASTGKENCRDNWSRRNDWDRGQLECSEICQCNCLDISTLAWTRLWSGNFWIKTARSFVFARMGSLASIQVWFIDSESSTSSNQWLRAPIQVCRLVHFQRWNNVSPAI